MEGHCSMANQRYTEPTSVRVRTLEQQLARAMQEIEALKTARDAAIKMSVWGGRRLQERNDGR